jgi:protein TonB
MIARVGVSLSMGVVVTFALLWLMQFLIASGRSAITDKAEFRFADFIRVRQEETLEQKDRKPTKPPQVEQPPPDMPPPQLDNLDPNTPMISMGKVNVNFDVGMQGGDFAVDGEYLPIVRVEPIYPRRAQSRGIEGFCDMEFTVTKTGEVTDAVALECSSSVFQSASTKAVLKWKYKPRVLDGDPIDSPGVQTRLTYQFEN